MDKTKKYRVGSGVYEDLGHGCWGAGLDARMTDNTMQTLINDGIATEVKEKFKGSMVVDMTHEGYVHSHTTNRLGMCDLSMEFGNIIRAAMGSHMATASRKFQVDITEL